jgi:hypothetical protein
VAFCFNLFIDMKNWPFVFFRLLLVSLAISVAQVGKSQALLDADSAKITRQMLSQGAKLQNSRVEEVLI